MHVIHTVGSLAEHHGGPSRSITALCSALAEAAVDIELFTLDDGTAGSHRIFPASGKVQLRVLPGHEESLRSARAFRIAIERAVRSGKSVIHEHGMWLPLNHAVAGAATRTRTPRVVSPRGMLSTWALNFRRWKKAFAWRLYQSRDLAAATVIHVTAPDEAAAVRASGIASPIAVIPNGVFIPAGQVGKRRTDSRRRALFLSRVHPAKGVLDLVEAWSRVRPIGWKLSIAGPNDDGHQLEVEAAVARNGLSEHIEFLGSVREPLKWSLFAESDLFILPTYSENFGIAIAEALASGLPVITTKAAPWSGIIRHNCGWWTDVGAEALVSALRESTSLTDDRLRELGSRGRAFVTRDFSWDRISSDMKDVYNWLLDGGAPPASVELD